MELYINCEYSFDLYNELNKYFNTYLTEDEDNTMGAGDIKIVIDVVEKGVSILSNIFKSFFSMNKTKLCIKNGEKEFCFEGKLLDLESEQIKDIICSFFEE